MTRPASFSVVAARLWPALFLCAMTACAQRDAAPRPAAPEAQTSSRPLEAAGERTSPPEPSQVEPGAAAKLALLADGAAPTTASPAPSVERADAGAQTPRKRRAARVIHPQPGQSGCVEMYGECTRDKPPVCTSSALALDCDERGRLPSTGEPLHCVCP